MVGGELTGSSFGEVYMRLGSRLANPEEYTSRVFNLFLIVVLLAAFTVWEAGAPSEAIAAPAISVSTSVSNALLGDTATVRITATNTGPDKGYNLSFETTVSASVPPTPTVDKVAILNPSVPPTTESIDPSNHDVKLAFFDLADLAPGESFTLTFEVDISNNPNWEVGDLVLVDTLGYVNDIPDSSGTWRYSSDSAQGEVIPIDLVTKTANQSTQQDQATGTTTRAYSYTIEIQNNYVNPSESVVVTDTVPDGIDVFTPSISPACDGGFPSRDPVTGETHLQWTLGTMAPGATQAITYGTGIRYDYYGTANGGNNDTTPGAGAPVPHDTSFPNTASLESEYKGSLPATITPTDSDSASVTGAYMTLDKAGTPETGGVGTVVTYTLNYYTSEYYTTDDITLTDTIGDGLTYVPGSASVTPDSITDNPDGSTTLVWLPSTIGTIGPSVDASLTLQASMDATWTGPPITDQPVRAGDSMTNDATLTAAWHDQVNPPRQGVGDIAASAGASINTRIPGIDKSVWDPNSAAWVDSPIDAQVGDEVMFRLRFNTDDGATPERSDISLGYIAVTDWIPPGTAVSDYATPTVSDWGDFRDTTSPTTRSVNPTLPVGVTLGALQGYEWFLGDVAPDGWWETTFTVTVLDDPGVQPGLKTGNHWKMTGANTVGDEYSDRDIIELALVEPHLTLDKAAAPSTDLVPGDVVTYDIEIFNDGTGVAEDVLVVDTLPVGMRLTTPTVGPVSITTTSGTTPLAEGTDYLVSYDATSGVMEIDLHDTTATVDTSLPASATLDIRYTSSVDPGVGAGASLTDIASVGYSTQKELMPGDRVVPPNGNTAEDNTDDATVTLVGLTIAKSGPSGQQFRVGDTWTYYLDVTVPAGAVAYRPDVRDRNEEVGIWYVSDSATITTLAGTPTIGAAFDTTSTPARDANATRVIWTWDLADTIDNSGSTSDYTFRLAFDVQYTGVRDNGTQEFWLPSTGNNGNRVQNNWSEIRWYPLSSGGSQITDRDDTNVDTRIHQPLLEQTKSAARPGPYAGDQVATYTASIRNTQPVAQAMAIAYDLYWDDILDPLLTSPTLVSVSHSASGSILASVTPDFSAPPTLTIDFGDVTLAPQQQIDIVYTAMIAAAPPASALITNTVDVNWSSLPGSPPGSRVYDDQAWESNYSLDTTQEVIPVAQPSIVKTIVSGNPATIGDTVTYNLRVTVPSETVLPAAYLEDITHQDGMRYTGVPAPTISDVSGVPFFPATIASITATDTSPAPGSTLTAFLTPPGVWNYSVLAGVGDVPYVFDFTYSMLVDGLDDAGNWTVFPPTASDVVGDTGSAHWVSGGIPLSVSDTATLGVDQPLLSLDKSVITTGPYFGGDAITYETTIENVGWSTAYDIDWEDVIASQMSTATLLSVTTSTDGSVITSVTPDFSSEPTLTIDFGTVSLSPGATATVVYSVEIDPGAGSGSFQTNTADVDWSSLEGTPANSRRYDDGPDESGWTSDTDTETIQIQIPALLKTVESGDTTRTIGESFYYEIFFSVPASTTAYNIFIDDLVPNGLSVSGTQIVNGPATTITVGPRNALGQTPVVWDVGDVTNPPDEVLQLRILTSVDETYAVSGMPVNGLVPQDTITNRARITWDDADTGGTTRSREDSKTVTIEEPNLTIDKASSETTLQAGQSTTYTTTITNTGTSPAYEFEWTDIVAPELFSAGSSPALVSVTLDGSAPTSYTTDFGVTATSTVVIDDPIPAGSTIVITYTATMNGGITSGVLMPNTATIEQYASLPDTDSARFYGPISDAETVTSTAPELTVGKVVSGDQQVQEGQTTEYTVTITNIGDATAYAVHATDTAPSPPFSYVAGSTSASWPSGSSTANPTGTAGGTWVWDFGGSADLGPGQTLTLVYESQAATGTPTGPYDNNITVVADDGGGTPIPSVDDTATVLVTDPELAIDKTLAAGQDPFVQVGQTVTYDIAVTNTGDTTMTTVPLEDAFEAAYLSFSSASPAETSVGGGVVLWNDITGAGSLGVGQTTTVTVTFDVIGHPPTSSSDDTATISGAVDVFGDSPEDVSDTETIGITNPQLSVDKSLTTSGTARVGDTVSFDIGVTNTGDTTLTSIPATDTYDGTALLFTSATPTETTGATGTITWADVTGTGDLAPGATTTITMTYRAIGESIPTTNTFAVLDGAAVDVNGDGAAGDTDSDTVDVVEPSIIIGKVFGAPTIGPGESVNVTVLFLNAGSGPAYDVSWYDIIPPELFSAGSSPTTPTILRNGFPLVPGVDCTFDFSSSPTATIDFLTPIAPGDLITINYDVTLNGGHPAGRMLTNVAVVDEYSSLPGTQTGEAYYGPVVAMDPIMTRAPALTLNKTVTGDTEVQHGQEVSYDVTLANTGNDPAYSLVVTDTLPPGTIYSPSSALVTYSLGMTASVEPMISGQTLVWDLGPMSVLPPGEDVTISFRSLVTSIAPYGLATNYAVGGANDGGSVPTTPSADLDTFLVTLPSHSVSKHLTMGQDQHIQVGETVTFDMVIDNDGTTTITVLPLEDTYDPTYLSYNTATPAPDTAAAGALTWNNLAGGGLAPGDATTVTVTFTAIAHPPTSVTTNRATAPTATDEWGDPVPPDTDTADIGITEPSVSVTKTLAASQDPTVSVGATVDFDLVFTNSGDTTLTSIPATDTYVFGELEFLSASPSVSATGPGTIAWSDITGAGTLAPGASTTVTVQFRALNEAIPTTDTVTIDDGAATDINGDGATGDSDSASVVIVEPALTIDKEMEPGAVGPGESVVATVTIQNTGTGPAYDTMWSDVLPSELTSAGTTFGLISVTRNGVPLAGGGIDYTADTSANPTVTIDFATAIQSADTIVIVYSMVLQGGTPAGLTLTNDATIDEYSSLPGTDPNERIYGPHSDADSVNTLAPELSGSKNVVGDTELQWGQTVSFELTVTNSGSATAYSVVATDTLPTGVTYTWGSSLVTYSTGTTAALEPSVSPPTATWHLSPIAPLNPGDSATIAFDALVTGSTPLGVATNTVEFGGKDGGGWSVEPTTGADSFLVTDPSQAIDKHLQPGQDTHIQVGQDVTFEIVVTNDGTTDIVTAPLTDTFDATYLSFQSAVPAPDSTSPIGTLTWNDITGAGSLAVGDSTTITATFTAIAHPATSLTMDRAVAETGTDQYDDPVPSVEDTESISITDPSVDVTKTLSAGEDGVYALGEIVSYDIGFTNSGDTRIVSLPATDTYDATNLSFVSSSPTPTAVSTGTIVWSDLTTTLGDLDVGETVTTTVQFEVIGAMASVMNTATVLDGSAIDEHGDGARGDIGTQPIDTYDPADVGFTKTADPPAESIVLPGDVITYSIELVNGTDITFPNTVITDVVPDEVTYNAETMTMTRSAVTTSLTDAPDADAGTYDSATGTQGSVVYSLGDVSPGETITVTFDVTVRAEEYSRHGIANNATVTVNGDLTAEVGPVIHHVDPFDIIKTAVDVNGGLLEAGDEILWTITVSNTGITPTTHVVVTDEVPPETTYVNGSITGRGADGSSPPDLVWSVGTMQVDETVVLTFKSTVNSGLPAGTSIENQAWVVSDQSLPKGSDFPETSVTGDPTLLQTGGNDWAWLILALLLASAGYAIAAYGRRRMRLA